VRAREQGLRTSEGREAKNDYNEGYKPLNTAQERQLLEAE
jgi:hypothetical protein